MSQAQLIPTANPTEKREKPGYAGYYDNEKYSDSKSFLRA